MTSNNAPGELEKYANQDLPSDEEFWTVVQRYFSFEEPSSRWSKHRKSLQKQLKRVKSDISEIDSMTLLERSSIFSHIFGNGNIETIEDIDVLREDQSYSEKLNEKISLLFAFAEIRLFRSLAFDLWKTDDTLDKGDDTPPVKDISPADQFTERFELSTAEAAWLKNAELSSINWLKLIASGPWDDDPRRVFVVALINRLSTLSKEHHSDLVTGMVTAFDETLKEHRSSLPAEFLPESLVLVEGQSEEILLPRFGELKGLDFRENAVHVKSCGGAKQVVRQYLNLRDILALPIASILDADVLEEAEILKESLRDEDLLLVLADGELEDSFEPAAFIKMINEYIGATGSSTFLAVDKLRSGESRVKQMTQFWRRNKLGSFDKIEFAQVVSEKLESIDVPREFSNLMETIRESNNHARKELRFAR